MGYEVKNTVQTQFKHNSNTKVKLQIEQLHFVSVYICFWEWILLCRKAEHFVVCKGTVFPLSLIENSKLKSVSTTFKPQTLQSH